MSQPLVKALPVMNLSLSKETEFYYLCRPADETFSSTPVVFSIKSGLVFQWKLEVNLW